MALDVESVVRKVIVESKAPRAKMEAGGEIDFARIAEMARAVADEARALSLGFEKQVQRENIDARAAEEMRQAREVSEALMAEFREKFERIKEGQVAKEKAQKVKKSKGKQKAETESEMETGERYKLAADARTKEVIFYSCKRAGPKGEVARKVWEQIRKQAGARAPSGENDEHFTVQISPPEWEVLQLAIEDFRVASGEITPELEELREQVRSNEREAAKIDDMVFKESLKYGNDGLLSEKEKPESLLYNELTTVVREMAAGFGYKPQNVELEIVRNEDCNAFVVLKTNYKEGEAPSGDEIPLRVFVNAGLISAFAKVLPGGVTMDHIALLIGHELAHLKQKRDERWQGRDGAHKNKRWEYEADSESMMTMDRNGLNPQAAVEVMTVFAAKESAYKSTTDVLAKYVLEAHPESQNRLEELLKVFHDPSNPMFSAQAEKRPVTAEMMKEVDWMLRRKLKEEVSAARNIVNFRKIFREARENQHTDLQDVLLIGRRLKLALDAQLALAEGARQLRESEGLAAILLYVANYTVQRRKAGLPLDLPHGSADFGEQEERVIWNMAIGHPEMYFSDNNDSKEGMVSIAEDKQFKLEKVEDDARGLFAVNEATITKVAKEVISYCGTEVVDATTFKTADDLFDAQNSEAVAFWRSMPGLVQECGQVKDSMYSGSSSTPKSDSEFLLAVKEKVWRSFSNTVCFGANRQWQMEVKDNNIDEIKSTAARIRAALDKISESQSGEQVAGMPVTGIGLRDIARARDWAAGRVGQYTKPAEDKPVVPSLSGGKEFASFGIWVEGSLVCPDVLGDEMFHQNEYVPGAAGASPWGETLAEYFALARSVFDKTLSVDNLQQEYGMKTVDDENLRQVMFEDLFRDFFFDTKAKISGGRLARMTAEQWRKQPAFFDYIRAVGNPAFGLRGTSLPRVEWEKGKPLWGNPILFMAGDWLKDEPISNDDFLIGLKQLRIWKQHPVSQYFGFDTFKHGDDELPEGQIVARRAIKKEDVKMKLFERWVKTQLASFGRTPEEQVTNILIARAEAAGLPAGNYLKWWNKTEAKGIRKFLGIPTHSLEIDARQMASIVNGLFKAEYVKYMVDDVKELRGTMEQRLDLFPSLKGDSSSDYKE